MSGITRGRRWKQGDPAPGARPGLGLEQYRKYLARYVCGVCRRVHLPALREGKQVSFPTYTAGNQGRAGVSWGTDSSPDRLSVGIPGTTVTTNVAVATDSPLTQGLPPRPTGLSTHFKNRPPPPPQRLH